jgi:hypothetical protein
MWNPVTWLWGTSEATQSIQSAPAITPEDTLDDLAAKRMQLLHKASRAKNDAKAFNAKGDTTRAMALMRQKQMYDKQAASYEGMISNMEKTSLAIDTAATSVQVAGAMRGGVQQLQSLMKEVSIDDIDTVGDDLSDVMSDSAVIATAISRPIGGEPDEDEEAALRAEMALWGSPEVAQQRRENPKEPQVELNLPSVPSGRIAVKNRVE